MSDLYYGEFSTDVTPPEVTNPFPANGLTEVSRSTNVEFDISDAETGVDLVNTVVVIDGVTAYDWDGVGSPEDGIQAGFTGGITGDPNSYHFLLNPDSDLPNYKLIIVGVESQDLAPLPNVMTPYFWTFTTEDTIAPEVTNPTPVPSSKVHPSSNIEFDLGDDGAGVDLVNTLVRVEGAVVYDWDGVGVPNDGIQAGWGGSIVGDPSSYHFLLNPDSDFPENDTITVQVDSQDLYTTPNVMPTYTWDFDTADISLPQVANYSPTGFGVPIFSNVQFDVFDALGSTGIDLSTLDVTVKGVTVIAGGVPQPGYIVNIVDLSPGVNGYRVTIDPLVNFDYGTIVPVTIDVADLSSPPNVMPTFNWSFTTQGVISLVSASAVDDHTVEAEYSIPVEQDAVLYDPSNYAFRTLFGASYNIYAESIRVVTPKIVHITLRNFMLRGAKYELTVNNVTALNDTLKIQDGPGPNTAIFDGLGISKKCYDMLRRVPTWWETGPGSRFRAILCAAASVNDKFGGDRDDAAVRQTFESMILRTAEGEDLSVIGQNYGVTRPKELQGNDDLYRKLIPVLATKRKSARKIFHDALEALFGPQTTAGWDVFEVNPELIEIDIPASAIYGVVGSALDSSTYFHTDASENGNTGYMGDYFLTDSSQAGESVGGNAIYFFDIRLVESIIDRIKAAGVAYNVNILG